jgi:WD40 repeat protein
MEFAGHKDQINALSWSKQEGSRLLASASNDCTVRVWDLDEAKCKYTL